MQWQRKHACMHARRAHAASSSCIACVASCTLVASPGSWHQGHGSMHQSCNMSRVLSSRIDDLHAIDVQMMIEPMDEQPRKRSWYFDDDKVDRSSIQYPHPTPVPAVRLKQHIDACKYDKQGISPAPLAVNTGRG
eukprot:352834-Chlamydomonas_euryale.AAC.4